VELPKLDKCLIDPHVISGFTLRKTMCLI